MSKKKERELNQSKCLNLVKNIMTVLVFISILSIMIPDMQNPGTNYFAHITGFIFGFVITYLYDTYRIWKEKLLN
jgi:membrane associated rhomboid family serine protease